MSGCSPGPAIADGGEALDMSQQTLRHWVKQTEVDAGPSCGLMGDEKEELK